METTRMSFLAKRMGNFANLANWPNANVLNTALVTEYIPEMCKVPYDLCSVMIPAPWQNALCWSGNICGSIF